MINLYVKIVSQLNTARNKTLTSSMLLQNRNWIKKIQYLILGIMVGGFNVWMMIMLLQPAQPNESQFVVQYSEQALYPRSRVIAQHWRDSAQPPNRYMYFKFLRTLDKEQRAVHTVVTDQEKIDQ